MRALAPKQRVSIFVNEKPVTTIEVDGADEALRRRRACRRASSSAITACCLTFKCGGEPAGRQAGSAAALKMVAFGPAALGAPKGELGYRSTARDVTCRWRCVAARSSPGGSTCRAFRSTFSSPRRRRLALGVTPRERRPAPPWLVRVSVDGQRPRTLHEGRTTAAWTDVVLPLGAASNQAARIDLVARGGDVAWSESARRRQGAPRPSPAPTHARLRAHLRVDGRHAARRQGARVQPEDARADAQLRRLRRGRDALRVGAGCRARGRCPRTRRC